MSGPKIPKGAALFCAAIAILLLGVWIGSRPHSATVGSPAPPHDETAQVADNPTQDDADDTKAIEQIARAEKSWHYQIFTDEKTGYPRYIAHISEVADFKDPMSLSIVIEPSRGVASYLSAPTKQFDCRVVCSVGYSTTNMGSSHFDLLTVPGHPESLQIANLTSVIQMATTGQTLEFLMDGQAHDFNLRGFNWQKFKPNDWREAMEHDGDNFNLGRE
jgi:hypothetical protein